VLKMPNQPRSVGLRLAITLSKLRHTVRLVFARSLSFSFRGQGLDRFFRASREQRR
jgi:hypothetical protein